jgi:hypothetical protein
VTMPMSSKISWNSSRYVGWAGNNFLLSLYMDWRIQVMSPFVSCLLPFLPVLN